MVLLEVIRELSAKHAWRLTVAHFNHRLRGRSSAADEKLVAWTTRMAGLRFVRGSADVRKHAAENGVSVEMAARNLRHAFLARVAARLRISTITLAHHADDQVELFFLRLFRGAGGEGLAGMKWSNPSPQNQHVRLVRPLLDQPKSALTNFAKENGVRFRQDATNAQREILRNRVRHELIPLLEQNYQPALTRVILRLMEVLGAEAQVITDWARSVNESRARTPGRKARGSGGRKYCPFRDLPVAVQRRCLQLQAVAQGLTTDFELIETLRKSPDRPKAIDESRVVSRDIGGHLCVRLVGEPKFNRNRKSVRLQGRGGRMTFDRVEIRWQAFSGGDGTFRARMGTGNTEYLDADRVGTAAVLRHWQPGDRFQPIGMAVAVKLQDLFTNQKVLRDMRHKLIVGATADGEIFWVEGLRLGERFKLDKQTQRRLKWMWKRV
jgi:tRNA(Ile)-lysidine synthase